MTTSVKDLPALLTPAQLAEITGAHPGSIRRGIAEGRIPADKINGRYYIAREAVLRNALLSVDEIENGATADDDDDEEYRCCG